MAKDPYFIEPSTVHTGPTQVKTNAFGMIALIIGVLLAVVAVIFMFSSNTLNPEDESQRLIWRLESLDEMLVLGKRYSQSDDMRRFTSNSIILIGGVVPPVEDVIKTAGYKKTNKDIKAAEADAETLELLRTAGVNGRFDPSYKEKLSDKLRSVMDQLDTTDDALKSKEFKTAGGNAYTIFKDVYDALQKIDV